MFKNKNLDFEDLPKDKLADLLQQFYGSVRTKKNEIYGKRSINNLRSGINRHLTLLSFNRVINIMRDPEFQVANKILTGQLRRLRKSGQVKTKRRTAVSKADLGKMYDYVCSNLDNPTVLQYKVYLNIAFCQGLS